MKSKFKFMCCALMMCLFSLCAAGCKDPSIEIYIANSGEAKVYEVTPGEEVQFEARVENLSEDTIEYLITDGQATITKQGKLKVDEDAIVSSTITVMAQSGDTKSNKITLNVVDLKPDTIDLTGRNRIAKGDRVPFNVTFDPSYATLKDYTLSVVQGGDFAEIDNGDLVIKDNAVEADIVGEVIKVKATLNADNTISDTVDVTVVEKIEAITVTNAILRTYASTAQQYLEVEASNPNGNTITGLNSNYFEYSSSDATVATIDPETGRIVPHGHGTTTITVSADGVQGQASVSVIVVPETIALNGVSTLINTNKVMSYSKVDKLNLDVEMTHSNYICTDKVKYTFKKVDEVGATLAEGDAVAVVTDDGIEFKTTGKVVVTISSDSKIGTSNPSSYEKKMDLVVNVNDGINVDTVDELKAYADIANAGKICNITKDIYLTATENFGVDDELKYKTLEFQGDRTINGNGYVISTADLPLIMESSGGAYNFLEFDPVKHVEGQAITNDPFSVEINDLELIGCTNVNGKYYDDNSINMVMNDGCIGYSYRRGLVVSGTDECDIETQGKDYANLTMSNVTISGFDVGMRLCHVVDGYVTGCSVSNCYSNGIESNQNIIEFNNMNFGQVGAFGIEVTPDDMRGKETANPYGTAGVNYDQTSEVKMTGTIISDNYNNGSSTPYMIQEGYSAIPTIVDGIISYMVNEINKLVPGSSDALANLADSCLYNHGNMLSFYSLIFVNPGDFPQYTQMGNMEEKFCKYTTDSAINIQDVLEEYATALAGSQDYDDYKDYKYIIMDLQQVPLNALNPIAPAGVTVNIGQVVLVNQAYEG